MNIQFFLSLLQKSKFSFLSGQIVYCRRMMYLFGPFLLMAVSTAVLGQDPTPSITIEPHQIVVTHHAHKLAVSIDCPFFDVGGQIIGGDAPIKKFGDIRKSMKEPFRIAYPNLKLKGGGQIQAELFIQWSPKEKLLHKWVSYSLSEIKAPVLIKEIVLDRLNAKGLSLNLPAAPGQSYPVLLTGYFAGIEYPVSSVRMESEQVVIAHQPGLRLKPGVRYQSRKAVYGATPPGQERAAFLSYISAYQLSGSRELHVNYNSWWTSPVPYSEKNILELMETFNQKLYLNGHESFNTFCIDMGWSDPKSIWDIDTNMFPKKFNAIQQAAKKMNTNLGLWISPSTFYAPESVDTKWAEREGYETFNVKSTSHFYPIRCCLAGKRYGTAFRNKLVNMVQRYEIKQVKLDGYNFVCPESDHGHEPGNLSMEAIAASLIETCLQIHQVSPETWIETTCMGYNPSPWWLFYASSVIGTFGGDFPEGRIPSPVYRESYTSARDFFNLQGAAHIMTPISSQEVLGVIHQTSESFANDAVTTIMRGHMFLPLYVNPKFMNASRWKMMVDMITWARNNTAFINNTIPLFPKTWQNGDIPKGEKDPSLMPREPYGYAHCNKNEGLIELRNPWIENSGYTLKIDSSIGLPKQGKNLNIVSIYPEVRVYAKKLQYGDTITIPLAPYETLVLSVTDKALPNELPRVTEALRGFDAVKINKIDKTLIKTTGINHVADSASPATSMVRLSMEGSVNIVSTKADLLILMEGNNDAFKPEGTVYINGNKRPLVTTENSRVLPRWGVGKKYWTFLKAPLYHGENVISFKIDLPRSSPQRVSVWGVAHKSGGNENNNYPNALPQPENVSLASINLIESFDTEAVNMR
ncbi:hypothetical protein [Niabella aurantiaca]|uniref:hypothetical protein n=1 Tax=Niabella aurantiaca TaxID=379900 RepID=UPI0003A765E3|nr:hypothetical protein [Niabella aurantiaca]